MKTIQELLAVRHPKQEWLCDPYVARRGITFMHGKTSIGKSPITWELARCVDQGLPFLGWPTTQARVLYLEADTAEPLMQRRLDFLPEPIGNWGILDLSGLSLDLLSPANEIHRRLRTVQAAFNPELVIWNTLRQFYQSSSIEADTVPKVYASMYRTFPSAGHMVVAHDRKTSRFDEDLDEAEAFSGSNAWRDLATIALHVTPRTHKGQGLSVKLTHTKSQVSELVEPKILFLAPDGTRLSSTSGYAQQIEELWSKAPEGTRDRGQWVAEQLGISRRTVFNHRRLVHDDSVALHPYKPVEIIENTYGARG